MGKLKAGWLMVLAGVTLGVSSCGRVPLPGRTNGEDLLATGLVGWQQIGGRQGSWQFEDGVLSTEGQGGNWLSTVRQYEDFELSLEFRVGPEGNSGVFVRAPHRGDPAYAGMEIQILDDHARAHSELRPNQYTGSIYGVQAPSERASEPAEQWQKMIVSFLGPLVKIVLNGRTVVDTNTTYFPYKYDSHPGLARKRGYIGLQDHGSPIAFRNIHVKPLTK